MLRHNKTRASHAGANAGLQVLSIVNKQSKFEVNIISNDRDIRKRLIFNKHSKLKKRHNCVKNILRATLPTGMGFAFRSKQLVRVTSSYL